MKTETMKYIAAILEKNTGDKLFELNRLVDVGAGTDKLHAAADVYAAAKRAESDFSDFMESQKVK